MNTKYIDIELDGLWYLAADETDQGKSKNWAEHIPDGTIILDRPFIANHLIREPVKIVWYWHKFECENLTKNAFLNFQGADYSAQVWLNGEFLGENESAMLPFGFKCGKNLHKGQNLIAVRVVNARYDEQIDGFKLGYVPGGRQNEDPWDPGHRFLNFGGLTGDVQLKQIEETYITDVFIKPDIKQHCIEVQLETFGMISPTTKVELAVSGSYPQYGSQLTKQQFDLTQKTMNFTVKLEGYKLWDLNDPNLYILEVKLFADDVILDMKTERFGMRHVEWKNGRVHLNGKPIILKGALYNQIYPVTLGQPSNNFEKIDVELAKEANLNCLRMFSKPPTHGILNACDEIGILAHVETMAAWWLWEGKCEKRQSYLRNQMIRVVKAFRNHPCIFLWCCLNEPRLDCLRAYAVEELVPELVDIDDTRIILSDDPQGPASPGFFAPNSKEPDKTSFFAHLYFFENFSIIQPQGYSLYGDPQGQIRTMRGRDFGKSIENSKNKSRKLPLLHAKDEISDGTPFYLSEWGIPYMPNWDRLLNDYSKVENYQKLEDFKVYNKLAAWHKMQWKTLELSKKGFESFEDFVKASQRAAAKRYEEYLTTLWGNPNAIGHCLTSMEDSNYEVSGLVDAWRNRKGVTFDNFKHFNRPVMLNLDWQPRCIYTTDALNFDVSLVHAISIPKGTYELQIDIVGNKNNIVFAGKYPVEIQGQLISFLYGGRIYPSLEHNRYEIVASLLVDGVEIDRIKKPLYVYERRNWKKLASSQNVYCWQQKNELQELIGMKILKNFDTQSISDKDIIIVTKSVLDDSEVGKLHKIYKAVNAGASVAFLDHQIFAERPAEAKTSDAPFVNAEKRIDFERNKYLSSWDGFKPDPLLPCWGYGGMRYATKHPLLDGLPTGVAIGETDVYARVCAVDSWQIHQCGISDGTIIETIPLESPCNCIEKLGCDMVIFWANSEWPKWYGSDLMSVKYGKGNIILTTLNLIPNLNLDPATDFIVYNIIKFLGSA